MSSIRDTTPSTTNQPSTPTTSTRKASKASIAKLLKALPVLGDLQHARQLARTAQAHSGIAWSCDYSDKREATVRASGDPMARAMKDLRSELAKAGLSGIAFYARLEVAPTGKLHAHGVMVPLPGMDPEEFRKRIREPFVRAFGRITKQGAAPHQFKVKPIHDGNGWGSYILSTKASWLTSRIRKLFPDVKLDYTSQALTRLANDIRPRTITPHAPATPLAPAPKARTTPRLPSNSQPAGLHLHHDLEDVLARCLSCSRLTTATSRWSAAWVPGPSAINLSTGPPDRADPDPNFPTILQPSWLATRGRRAACPTSSPVRPAPRKVQDQAGLLPPPRGVPRPDRGLRSRTPH